MIKAYNDVSLRDNPLTKYDRIVHSEKDNEELIRKTLLNIFINGNERVNTEQNKILENWSEGISKRNIERGISHMFDNLMSFQNDGYTLRVNDEFIEDRTLKMMYELVSKYDAECLYCFNKRREIWLIYSELSVEKIQKIENYSYCLIEKYNSDFDVFVLEKGQVKIGEIPTYSCVVERDINNQ